MKQSHHVISAPAGRWSVRRTGAGRASKTFDSRDDAVVYARDHARRARTDLFVHRTDGTVESIDRFGEPTPASGGKR